MKHLHQAVSIIVFQSRDSLRRVRWRIGHFRVRIASPRTPPFLRWKWWKISPVLTDGKLVLERKEVKFNNIVIIYRLTCLYLICYSFFSLIPSVVFYTGTVSMQLAVAGHYIVAAFCRFCQVDVHYSVDVGHSLYVFILWDAFSEWLKWKTSYLSNDCEKHNEELFKLLISSSHSTILLNDTKVKGGHSYFSMVTETWNQREWYFSHSR